MIRGECSNSYVKANISYFSMQSKLFDVRSVSDEV